MHPHRGGDLRSPRDSTLPGTYASAAEDALSPSWRDNGERPLGSSRINIRPTLESSRLARISASGLVSCEVYELM